MAREKTGVRVGPRLPTLGDQSRPRVYRSFRNQVLHEPILPELFHEFVRGGLVVLPVPGGYLASRELPVFCLQEFVAQYSNRQPIGFAARSATSQEVIFLVEPLFKGLFPLRIVNLFAEVVKLAANLLGPMTAPFVTEQRKVGRGLSGFDLRLE